ncbi:MAG: hypothetical protein NTW87_08655 [Planctomycetota bacterium]|nr:hypothetical protein [Planctomycetota bacterium]
MRRFGAPVSVLLLAVFATSAVCAATDSAEEKRKKEEEALRQDALAASVKIGEGERLPASGKFALARDLINDGKPLPKVIGYLSSKGTVYPVMVTTQDLLNALTQYDNKDVNLTGAILDKGDKGKFFVATDLSVPQELAPTMKRKRGGLP